MKSLDYISNIKSKVLYEVQPEHVNFTLHTVNYDRYDRYDPCTIIKVDEIRTAIIPIIYNGTYDEKLIEYFNNILLQDSTKLSVLAYNIEKYCSSCTLEAFSICKLSFIGYICSISNTVYGLRSIGIRINKSAPNSERIEFSGSKEDGVNVMYAIIDRICKNDMIKDYFGKVVDTAFLAAEIVKSHS